MTIDDQVKKLQESQMFADRRTEELNDAVLDLSQRLHRLSDRLAVMESKLNALVSALTGDDDESTNTSNSVDT